MKKCYQCSIELNEETAYKRKGGTFQRLCKKCFNKYCVDRFIQKKKDAIEYKGGKCERCGYDKFYGAFDFHHRDPNEKEYDWSKLRLLSDKKIKAELDKCMLLCSNCHREIHNEILNGSDTG